MSRLHRRPRLCVLFSVAILVAGLAAAGRSSAVPASTPRVASLDLAFDVDSVDPAVSYSVVSWQLEYATCAKLLNYADSDGPPELQPEIAAQMPSISTDGRTYTFRIRDGLRFSPPAARERITAASVQHTFERALDPAVGSPAQLFLGDVVGIQVVGDQQDQLRFTLAQPAGDFLDRVTMPFFCVLPPGTPHAPLSQPPPSAGPYYISSYTPAPLPDGEGEIVLTRNPSYRGPRQAFFDEIRYRTGIPATESLRQILDGAIDYAPSGLPESSYPQLAAEFPDQFFVNPTLGFRHLALNTSRPLFSEPRIRQAVNYAIDRPALVEAFGPFASTPTDNYLPPRMPGSADAHIYPLNGPDLATARELAAGLPEGTQAVLYTNNTPRGLLVAQEVASNLAAIGIVVEIHAFSVSELVQRLRNPNEPFDIALSPGMLADFADPFELLNQLFDPVGAFNFSHLDDPVFTARLRDAVPLRGTARYDAAAELDLDLMEAAPLAAFGTINSRDFFSARIGCQVYQPVYGMSLVRLCLK